MALDRLYARGDAGVYPLPSGLPWVVNDTVPGAGAGLLPVSSTPSWVKQLKYLDPYSRVPATLSAAMSAGLDTEPCAEGGRNLGFISNNAVLMVRGVDFGAPPGAASLTLRAASPLSGGTVTVLLDGTPIGPPCAIPNTGDWQVFGNASCVLRAGAATGIAGNLSFVFNGPGAAGLMNLLFWSFEGGAASGGAPPPAAAAVALRAAATGLYACAADDAGAVVTPSGSAPCRWTLEDLEDGTWALATGEGGGGGVRYACMGGGGGRAPGCHGGSSGGGVRPVLAVWHARWELCAAFSGGGILSRGTHKPCGAHCGGGKGPTAHSGGWGAVLH